MRQRSSLLLLMIFALSLLLAVIPAAAQDTTPIVWAFVPSSDSETVLVRRYRDHRPDRRQDRHPDHACSRHRLQRRRRSDVQR